MHRQYIAKIRCVLLLALLSLGLQLPAQAEQLSPFTITASLNRTALTIKIEQQLTQAYREIGYQLNIEYLPAERSLKMSSQGNFDGELFRIAAVGEHYPQLLPVPVPLARVELYAFVKAGREHEFGQWQQDPKLRIGLVRGIKMAELYKTAGHKTIVNTPEQAVQMLQQDRIDLLLEDWQSLLEATTGDEQRANLIRLPELLAAEELFHFVHQRHQQLIPALSEQLQRQKHDKKRPK